MTFEYLSNKEYQIYTFAKWRVQDVTQRLREKYRSGEDTGKFDAEIYKKVLRIMCYLDCQAVDALKNKL